MQINLQMILRVLRYVIKAFLKWQLGPMIMTNPTRFRRETLLKIIRYIFNVKAKLIIIFNFKLTKNKFVEVGLILMKNLQNFN